MSLISPLREIMTLREAMDRLFEEPFFRPWSMWRRGTPEEPLRLPVDVYTTPEEIVIVASVPGLLPEEVDVSIQGDTLTIRGELRPPLDNVQYLFQERPYGPLHPLPGPERSGGRGQGGGDPGERRADHHAAQGRGNQAQDDQGQGQITEPDGKERRDETPPLFLLLSFAL